MTADAPPRYDEWLDFIFGRFERDSDNPWHMDWEFEASPADLADLFIYTMENCGRDLAQFSDGQVAIGLDALLFNNHGEVPHRLTGGGPSEQQRIAILRSITHLYGDCLNKRCPPVLGHLSETRGNPLEYVTYMLWDVCPYDVMAKKNAERFHTLLEVFSVALNLPNEACVESALHGLGHLGGVMLSGGRFRSGAKSLIQDWLDGLPQVRPELIEYAKAAQSGCIL